MKINKYILLLIAICVIMITFNVFKSRTMYRIPENGIHPGLPNSHVSLGRPL